MARFQLGSRQIREIKHCVDASYVLRMIVDISLIEECLEAGGRVTNLNVWPAYSAKSSAEREAFVLRDGSE